MIPEFSIPVWLLIALATPTAFYILRSLLFHYTSLSSIFSRWLSLLQDHLHSYNLYRIPRYNPHSQENNLFCRISAYIKSLPSLEDSDFVSLYSGDKPGDIVLSLDSDRPVMVLDAFLSARITWTCQKSELVLKIRSRDKKRVLLPYIQHIHKVAEDIEQRKNKELRIYLNRSLGIGNDVDQQWKSFPFVHPSSFDTVVLDDQVKSKVKGDLELFLKSKQYYNKIGRVWRRSYLLYGGSGTGKSTFAAAMAKFLSYDLYDIDLSKELDGSALKMLLMQTTRRSLILVESLDWHLMGKSTAVSLSAVLNFMDGVVSGCGEERVMVFTMNCKQHIDPLVMRPGRVDVHIYFPLCDFSGFKSLALSHLGIKDHRLFGQVEDLFQNGPQLSPAEISEIMISNRTSPARALKLLITTLESNGDAKELDKVQVQHRLNASGRERVSDDSDGSRSGNKRESVNPIREIQKFYGLIRLKNSKKEDSTDHLGSN